MFHASMRCASISATAHASACSRMRSANCVRRSGTSCLETSSPTMRRFGFRITAAATTGPNKAPRPASSKPAMRVQPSLRAARSKREEQRRLISAAILAREVKLGTRSQSERKTIPPPAKNFLPSLTASPTRPSMSGPTRNRLHSKGETMDRAILNIALCALLAVAACAFASGSSAQGLSSADLTRFRSIGSVALSPDGHRVAYTVVMRDRPGRPYGQLWLMDLATQKSSRIGGEKDSSGNPLWSPDGKWLAFDGRHDDKSGLFVARPDGSEIAFLTSTKGTNSPLPGTGKEVTWSPDSKQIAFISSTPGAEAAQASGDPMVITRYLYKPDAGEGKTRFNDNQRLHIFVVDISSKQVRQLTRADVHDEDVQTLVVVETRLPFAGIGLIEIARDDHGIAGSLRRFRSRRRRNERDLLAVGRPGHLLAGAGEWAVGAFSRSEKSNFRPIRARDKQSALIVVPAVKGKPFAVGRP